MIKPDYVTLFLPAFFPSLLVSLSIGRNYGNLLSTAKLRAARKNENSFWFQRETLEYVFVYIYAIANAQML